MRIQQRCARAVLGASLVLAFTLVLQPLLEPVHVLLHHTHSESAAWHDAHEVHAHRCDAPEASNDTASPDAAVFAADTGVGASHCLICEQLHATSHAKTLLVVREFSYSVYAASCAYVSDVHVARTISRTVQGRAPPVLAG